MVDYLLLVSCVGYLMSSEVNLGWSFLGFIPDQIVSYSITCELTENVDISAGGGVH